jgi:D-alanine-D-alanine ligase
MQPARPVFPDVTVVLGDPRLSDRVKRGGRFNVEDYEAFDRMKQALQELSGYRFRYLDDHSALLSDLLRQPPGFVFNLCDTGFRNIAWQELHVPALLEMLEIPFSGAGPACLALCYDKALVRGIASTLGVPVPAEVYIGEPDEDCTADFHFPALVKPSCGDGSVGITQKSVVNSASEAKAYIDHLQRAFPGRGVLLQEFLPGVEYSVGLIGNPHAGFAPFPPLEVDYSQLDSRLPQILAYESKADPASPYWTDIKFREATLDTPTRDRLMHYSRCLFERLGCCDYARFDFRADIEGRIKLLEVNPNAAWCWDGKLNMMAGFAGYSYAAFLRLLLEAAQTRVASSK